MEKIYTCYYGNTAYEQDKLPGILFLKNRGSVCFYNPDEDMFFDSDLKSFDINDKMLSKLWHFCSKQKCHNFIVPNR